MSYDPIWLGIGVIVSCLIARATFKSRAPACVICSHFEKLPDPMMLKFVKFVVQCSKIYGLDAKLTSRAKSLAACDELSEHIMEAQKTFTVKHSLNDMNETELALAMYQSRLKQARDFFKKSTSAEIQEVWNTYVIKEVLDE